MNSQRPRNDFLNLFLISFCFVAFMTGVYLLNRQSTEIIKKSPTIATPTLKVVPTMVLSNQTYTNTELGFSFEYPSLIGFDEQTEKNYLLSLDDYSAQPDNPYLSLMSISIKVGVTDDYQDFTINKKILISGVNSNEYDFHLNTEVPPPKRVVVLKHNEMYYQFSLEWDGNKESEKIFNQILSTFKFTDQKTAKFDGDYQGKNGKLKITTLNGATSVSGQAYWKTNTGEIKGNLTIENNTAVYNKDDCYIEFLFEKSAIKLKEKDGSSCGGLNVIFDGDYTKIN